MPHTCFMQLFHIVHTCSIQVRLQHSLFYSNQPGTSCWECLLDALYVFFKVVALLFACSARLAWTNKWLCRQCTLLSLLKITFLQDKLLHRGSCRCSMCAEGGGARAFYTCSPLVCVDGNVWVSSFEAPDAWWARLPSMVANVKQF